MIEPVEEKLCNRMKGHARCLKKLDSDKCPAEGKTPEEKKRNCLSKGKNPRKMLAIAA